MRQVKHFVHDSNALYALLSESKNGYLKRSSDGSYINDNNVRIGAKRKTERSVFNMTFHD
jgi:hypothetical protein